MDNITILNKAYELRRELGEDTFSPIDIFTLVQSIDRLSLVFYPMGQNISGVCVKSANNTVIAINSQMSKGRQRFTLAHELYHFLDNDERSTVLCYKEIDLKRDKEREADQFASYFLIPPTAIRDAMRRRNIGHVQLEDVIHLEQYFQVSHHAMLVRLVQDGIITNEEASQMQQGVIKKALSLGYNADLYRPSGNNRKYGTYGHLISSIEKAYELDLISTGKYEAVLLKAFRDDLVYGADAEEGDIVD